MRTKAVGMVLALLLVLCVTPATPSGFGGSHGPGDVPKQLRSQIDYWLVAGLGITDDEGRLLVWEGTIAGDLNGTMKWWFVIPPPFTGLVTYPGGRVNYYAARWEIWNEDGDKLLLAGESAGKTVTPGEGVGIWDGHGVVTGGRGWLGRLKGRHIYETGPVIPDNGNLYGTGIFIIH